MIHRVARRVLRAPAAAGTPGHWTRRVVTYFDAVAPEYARRYSARSSAGEALRIRRGRVLELLGQASGLVLDVGCGPGEMAQHLRAQACRFWGVDLSWGMVAEAHRRNTSHMHSTAFAAASAEQLPFRDGCFDAVLSMGVVEYTTDDLETLAEMIRVLRPGGVLVVTLAHRGSPYFMWKTLVYYPLVRLTRAWYCGLTGRARPPLVHDAKRCYAEGWLAGNIPPGGAVEEVVFCGFQVLPAPLDMLLPVLDVALMRRLQHLERSPLRWVGTTLIAKVRKL